MTDKHITKAIVLTRVDFGEADRVISLLTPSYGKLHLLAKGVRKEKSKLAGGIELFSEVEVGFIYGKKELGTLISSNLIRFFNNILTDIDKVQLMYKVLAAFNKVTEDRVEEEYYHVLLRLLELANDLNVSASSLDLYYKAQLLKLSGCSPNLSTDTNNLALKPDKKYNFDLDSMIMIESPSGRFRSEHLKYLRLLFSSINDSRFFRLNGTGQIEDEVSPLISAMTKASLSI